MEESTNDENQSVKSKFEELLPGGPPHSKTNLLQGGSAIFNGLGIGLFLGLLMGLSVSPVVSGVIGTISSMLAILIGLNEKFLDPIKSLRIGAFGLFSVAGIILGLYIRANDPFAPTLSDKMNEYMAIGYSAEEAKTFVTGFIRADSSAIAIRQANVLYSSEIEVGACDFLIYAGPETSPAEVYNTFKTAGGFWDKLADAFKNDLPEASALTALFALRDSFCVPGQSGRMTIQVNDALMSLGNESSLEQIEQAFKVAGHPWIKVGEAFNERFSPIEKRKVYFSLLDVLTHE